MSTDTPERFDCYTNLYLPPMTFVMNPANRSVFDEIVESVSRPTFACKVFMGDGKTAEQVFSHF